MTDRSGATTAGCVVDAMVLAMFADAGRADLLPALASGGLFVTPAVADPAEAPPFARQPAAEFARGAFYLQQRLGNPVAAVRFHRRVAFYLGTGTTWQSIVLSVDELLLAETFVDPAARRQARVADPAARVRRVGRGEAESAAVAVARGWTLWSDDAAILALLAALHPGHPVERITDLLARAVREELLGCQEAADLSNETFRATLGLWTNRTLACIDGQIVIR